MLSRILSALGLSGFSKLLVIALTALLSLGDPASAQTTGDALCDAMPTSGRGTAIRIVNRQSVPIRVMTGKTMLDEARYQLVQPGAHYDATLRWGAGQVVGYGENKEWRFSEPREIIKPVSNRQCVLATDNGQHVLIPGVPLAQQAPPPAPRAPVTTGEPLCDEMPRTRRGVSVRVVNTQSVPIRVLTGQGKLDEAQYQLLQPGAHYDTTLRWGYGTVVGYGEDKDWRLSAPREIFKPVGGDRQCLLATADGPHVLVPGVPLAQQAPPPAPRTPVTTGEPLCDAMPRTNRGISIRVVNTQSVPIRVLTGKRMLEEEGYKLLQPGEHYDTTSLFTRGWVVGYGEDKEWRFSQPREIIKPVGGDRQCVLATANGPHILVPGVPAAQQAPAPAPRTAVPSTGEPLCDEMPRTRRGVSVRVINTQSVPIRVLYADKRFDEDRFTLLQPGEFTDNNLPIGWFLGYGENRKLSRSQSRTIYRPTAARKQCVLANVGTPRVLVPGEPTPASQPLTPSPAPSTPAPSMPTPNPAPAPSTPAPSAPTPSPNPAPSAPAPLAPSPQTPAPAPADTPEISEAVPTPLPEDPEKKTCTEADLRALLKEGETSGTATLDGSCRYEVSTASPGFAKSALSVSNTMTIEGNGAVIARAAGAPNIGLLMSFAPTITIRNVTLRNGSSDGGGAVRANENIVLVDVTAVGNHSSGSGGAISSAGGQVTVTGGRLAGNTARKSGGAIWAGSGVQISGTKIDRNRADGSGGAILARGGDSQITDSEISHNHSGGRGGAVASWGKNLLIERSRLQHNFAKDHGGALSLQRTQFTILSSVLAANRTGTLEGAALYALEKGGSIQFSTIADAVRNPASAIFVEGTTRLDASIVARHTTGVRVIGDNSSFVERQNLYADNGSNFVARQHRNEGDSITAISPRFKDTAAGDYSLTAHSPAVDRLSGLAKPPTDIAGLAQPFAGTSPDIGAYEYQGAAEPVVIVEKVVPKWAKPGQPGDVIVYVANEGTVPARNLTVSDTLTPGLTLELGSITAGAQMAGRTISFTVPNLAPGEWKSFAYKVSAQQTVVSRGHAVTLDTGESFKGQPASFVVKPNLVALLDFFPRPDGFQFPNFIDLEPDDLTNDDLRNIFGAKYACKQANTNGPCVPRAEARAFRTKWLDIITGGRCAGMSMGSIAIFQGGKLFGKDLLPQSMDPTARETYGMSKTSARRLVTLFATTQTLAPRNYADMEKAGIVRDPTKKENARTKVRMSDPVDVLNFLIENLGKPGANDRFRISFRKRDKSGGHAVVPFAVERELHTRTGRLTGKFLIYVYENNNPGSFDRAFVVDPKRGTWSYRAQTNPGRPLDNYEGDRSTDTFSLVGWRYHTAFPKCGETEGYKTCTGTVAAKNDVPTGADGFVTLSTTGASRALLTREDGKRVGYDPVTGELLNEIEGTEIETLTLEVARDQSPQFRIPRTPGMTYSLQVRPAENVNPAYLADVAVYLQAPDFATALSGLDLAPAEGTPPREVSLGVAPDSQLVEVRSISAGQSRPNLSLAIGQPEGADIMIDVEDIADAAGMSLSFDRQSQSVQIADAGGGAVQVKVLRINQTGTEDAATLTAELTAEGTRLDLGPDWKPGGSPASDPGAEPGAVYITSVNFPDRRLVSPASDQRILLLPASEIADTTRAAFVVERDAADAAVVMLRVSGTQNYVTVVGQDVVLRQSGTFERSEGMFRVVAGLAGQDISLQPLARPGEHLRHRGFVLRSDPSDDTDLYRQDATFSAVLVGN